MADVRRIARSFTNIANGVHFGVPFLRYSTFEVPRRMRIRGQGTVPLSFPEEHGVKVDFLACVIRNDYGLGKGLGDVHTILDIGANVGLFSLSASDFYPRAKVHAYEPNPKVLPFLLANTRGLTDCTVFSEAVGGEACTVQMIMNEGDSNQAQTRCDEQGSIRQVAFREAIERAGGTVDLLKMDCEGAEWGMFQMPDCWTAIRHLRMEYHLVDGHCFQDVLDAMNKLHFTVTRHNPESKWGLVWADHQSA
jgi:FkbM family methyltransferase